MIDPVDKLAALISIHAGGAYNGHVYFRVKHPVTGEYLHTNFLFQVQKFCEKHNLIQDRDLIDQLLLVVDNVPKVGWVLKKDISVDALTSMLSVEKFLNSYQQDLF